MYNTNSARKRDLQRTMESYINGEYMDASTAAIDIRQISNNPEELTQALADTAGKYGSWHLEKTAELRRELSNSVPGYSDLELSTTGFGRCIIDLLREKD